MNANLIKEKQHTFTWKISNFNLLTQKKGEWIESPVFFAKSLDETSWCLKFFPKGDEEAEIGDMSCFLRRSENCSGLSEVKCEYKIEVFDTCNRSVSCKTSSQIFTKKGGWGSDFSRKQLSNEGSHSLDDTWTIKCHLIFKPQEPILRSESIGLTKVDTEQSSFKWIVKNLNSTCLETIKFPDTGTSQVEITVQAPDDDIKLSIRRTGSINPQYVMCRMTLLDLKGMKQDTKQATHIFEAEDSVTDVWEFPSFLKKSKLNSKKEKYIKADSFSLRCEISVTNGTMTSEIENKDKCDSETVHVPRIDNFAALKADIRQMYTDKSQTDVELIVGKKVFPAHKFILSARSPVFLAMFNQDMVENKTGQVDITDVEAKTLEFLLEFMYTGAVREMDCEMATKLLLAADKYQVLSLKEECSTFLKSVFTDSSVCDVLATADLIEDISLRDAAVSFIKKNSKKILKSVYWKRFVEKNLTLATNVVCEISTHLAEDNK